MKGCEVGKQRIVHRSLRLPFKLPHSVTFLCMIESLHHLRKNKTIVVCYLQNDPNPYEARPSGTTGREWWGGAVVIRIDILTCS